MTSRSTIVAALIVMAVGCAVLRGPAPVGAAPAEEVRSWTVTPASEGGVVTRSEFSYQADPGASIDDAVTVYNLGTSQLTFRVYAADASTTDDGAFTVAAGDVEPEGVGSWVTLEQELVTIPAGQQVTIPFTVDIPAGATPGDHAAGLVASVYESRTPDPTQPVEVEFRTGTRMYIRVTGEARSSLTIGSVRVSYDAGRDLFGGVADVTFRLLNQGTTRLSGSVTVSVRGPLGFGAKKVTLPDVAEILPGGQISVTARIEGVPAAGLLTATVNVSPASVDGVVDAPASSASASTLAVPWPFVLVVVLLSLAIYGSRLLRRRRIADEAGVALREVPVR